MHERFTLKEKHAVITGGTRGIGLAIARGFLEQGALVTICSRKQENVDAALGQLQDHSQKVMGVASHVGKSADISSLVSAAEQRFGTIHILVNNAGTNPYFGPIVDSDEAAWDKTLDVNLKGPYLLSKAVAKEMIQTRGGSIINIASIAGLSALGQQGIYSVSKAGLIMLTKVMARELGEFGIRVNCICPGLIKTKLSQALWADPDSEKSITALKALGRMGSPDEIVGAAVYLACDASSFTTGAVIQVDGGMVI